MNNHISSLLRLAIVTLATFPAFALAVPPTTSTYYTDVTNSYVHDQTSKVMSELNMILCFMNALGPDQMVNLTTNSGNYIALVDKNTCGGGEGSGGQSSNTGPAYTSVVVNSARASNSDPMLVKAWLHFPEDNDQRISVYASASQAPTATLPYGVFRMDFCGNPPSQTDCASDKGFINSTTSGLSFYSAGNQGGSSNETALRLNAASSTAGSGIVQHTDTFSGTTTFRFAYDANYFIRNDGTTEVCFDRSLTNTNADESVWRYGLYDANGAHVTRSSGFPVEYTDTTVTPNITYNGYIGYHGLWMPVSVPTGATVQQVTYGTSGPTKTPYTLLTTGGKLSKFTTALKTLPQLDKVTFWYWAQSDVGNGSVIAAGSQYELYWNNVAGQFIVSGKQNITSNNMEPLPGGEAAVANADMVAANPWGLFGWSQMMGGQFGIKGNELALLTTTPSAINVVTQIQDIVYPSQFAAIGGLKCINDCPTAALIAESNGAGPSTTPYSNQGWTPVAETAFVSYTLDATTGNLVDAASGAVVSTATTGTNANGVRSGRLVTPAAAAAMITAKEASGVCGGSTAAGACTSFGYNQGDVDFLPEGSSYYVWETGANQWNQLALLMSGSTPVTFDPPLSVNFVVPSDAKYGSYQGATIRLDYGGFGDLWGIPNECIDVATNAACVFSGGSTTPQQNQRWTSKFSIPFDTTNGVVTAGATTYYVKPLDKEIRLAKIPTATCTTAGLAVPAAGSVTLPVVGDWINPTTSAGTKPTFATVPAPQMIHGVKQY